MQEEKQSALEWEAQSEAEEEAYQKAKEEAAYEDEQNKEIIDKVCEWLDENLCLYVDYDIKGWADSINLTIDYKNLFEDLKKAMEEQTWKSKKYAISDDCYAHKADQVPDFEDIEWAFQTGAEWALKNLTL